MIIAKGIEIIPKRDKVTYATNISGKWENYSIDTYQGKVLKEAAERLKIMLKEGKDVSSEVPSLKQMLNQHAPEIMEEPVDIDFDNQPPEEYVDVPSAEVTVIKMTQKDLFQDTTSVDDGKKYVIVAGENRIGRTLYLSGFDDAEDQMISVVPYPTSKERCERMISAQIKKEAEADKATVAVKRSRIKYQYKIVEWVDPYQKQMKESLEEIERVKRERGII